MKVHAWADVRKRKLSKRKVEEINLRAGAEVLEMNLRALRELLGKTQAELADTSRMSQSELSRTERREDHLLSTLRHYVESLGGELEVIANFGDKRVRLRGV